MAEDSGFAMGYALGQDSGGGNTGGWGGFGDGIWALAVLALLFGRGGFGGFGGGGCDGGCATQADVRAAVDQQTLISKIDQQTYGIADTFTALNNTLNNNFRGIDNALCTLGYQGAQHASNLSAQLAKCCCDIEMMNMQTRFDAQTYNCNTLQAIDKLGDRILNYMVTEKTQALRDENQALRLAASQANQNQYLIDQLRPCPVPAYITCNPFAASYGYGTGYNNNGCGCGCG